MPEACRKLGIANATFFTLRKKYGGISLSEVKHIRQLEEESLRLKKLVAALSLDKAMLQNVLARLREWGRELQARYSASERHAAPGLPKREQVCLQRMRGAKSRRYAYTIISAIPVLH